MKILSLETSLIIFDVASEKKNNRLLYLACIRFSCINKDKIRNSYLNI